jgi:hypothetical protein
MIALATTGGIILGIVTVVFLLCKAKKMAFVALLKEHPYDAPTYLQNASSNRVTTSPCKVWLKLAVSIL